MKTLKKIMAVILLMIYATGFANGSDTKLESVQVKLMKMDDKYYLFLTDDKTNAYSNKDITATIKSDVLEGTGKKITLSPFGENAFVINGEPGDFKKLKAVFHLKSAEHNEYVYATLSNKHQEESSYMCPMHPGEMFKTEGKCPKCNMGLVAKKVSVYDPTTVVRKGSR